MTKVRVEGRALVVTGRHGGVVRFDELTQVSSEKRANIAYEEVILILIGQNGQGVVVSELDDGFAEAEAALRKHFPDIPESWWDDTEHGPTGVRTRIWAAP